MITQADEIMQKAQEFAQAACSYWESTGSEANYDTARAALRSAIVEALKDAERYRFLRSGYAEEHSYLGISTKGGSTWGIDADRLVDQEIARSAPPADALQQMEGER